MTTVKRIALTLPFLLGMTFQPVSAQTEFKGHHYPNEIKPVLNQCAQCHGSLGNLNTAEVPRINGLHKQYLVKQLKAFKTGKRIEPKMNNMMRFVSFDEIEAIANFYSMK